MADKVRIYVAEDQFAPMLLTQAISLLSNLCLSIPEEYRNTAVFEPHGDRFEPGNVLIDVYYELLQETDGQ